MKMIICLRCNRKKKHYAKGLCKHCYDHYRRGNVCIDCHEPVTDRALRCRICSKTKYKTLKEKEEAKKARYKRNREKYLAYSKDYYEENKERISLYKKEWFQTRKRENNRCVECDKLVSPGVLKCTECKSGEYEIITVHYEWDGEKVIYNENSN